MKKSLTLFLLFVFTISITAQQLNKVYVLSEGGFTPGSSQLSMLNVQSNELSNSIFSPGNIGLYPDGLFLTDTEIYLSEQGNYGGAGKVYKLDKTGAVIASSEVGTNPYSLTLTNNKVYITNGSASNVSVINSDDFSLVKDIEVGVYPQEIISNENYVFVANTSLWGGDSDSTISVISTNLDSVINTITVRLNPSSLALTNDNHLLIGCPGSDTNGVIYKVELTNFTKVDSFTIPTHGFGGNIYVNNETNKIYFTASFNDIIEFDLNSKESKRVVQPLDATYIYGYNYDMISNVHYLLDAKDFSANGNLLTYNSEGELLNTYETGVAPKRVVLDYSETTTDINDIALINNFNLDQNYPNPFNPTTNISFTIQGEGLVNISIYNVIGEKVSELLNEEKQKGSYNIEFDGKNLTSGIYFYSMKVNGFTSTKKMILAK